MQGITIQVNVTTLQEALKANRDKHAKEYAKAKKGWAKLLRKELTDMVAILDNGGELKQLHIENQKPASHLDEYDEALEMLADSAEPTVTLDAQLYRQFMRDDWSWRQHWFASNSTYIEAAR
jgi:hypothetical protein